MDRCWRGPLERDDVTKCRLWNAIVLGVFVMLEMFCTVLPVSLMIGRGLGGGLNTQLTWALGWGIVCFSHDRMLAFDWLLLAGTKSRDGENQR